MANRISLHDAEMQELSKRYGAPSVFPVQYIPTAPEKATSEIVFTNCGKEPAFDIRCDDVDLGQWQMKLRVIDHLDPQEKQSVVVMITGENNTSDLGWILRRWHKDRVDRDAVMAGEPAPVLSLLVRFKDRVGNGYVSTCEVGVRYDVDALQRSGGEVFLRLLETQRASGQTALSHVAASESATVDDSSH